MTYVFLSRKSPGSPTHRKQQLMRVHREELEAAMIHTFTILYILRRHEAIYCANRLNNRVTPTKRYKKEDKNHFFRIDNITEKHEGLKFAVPRVPGIYEFDIVRYKDTPGLYFLYIMIEPEVLLTGENTINVFWGDFVNAAHLQYMYARRMYKIFPKAYEGKPALEQVRYHDQLNIHPDDLENSNLYMLPHIALSLLVRIDFCCNYKHKDATLLIELIRKSYYSARKKEKRYDNPNPKSTDRSYDTLFYDKTSGFLIYNKYNKMMDPEKNRTHNIKTIREEAKDVFRIERPFYKITKEKLKTLTGLAIPKAVEWEEAPLKLGPWPYLCAEAIGLKELLSEYMHCVMGIKRNEWFDLINRRPFHWLSYKRFERALKNLRKEKKITEKMKDRIKKIAYVMSDHRSFYRAIKLCDAGTKVTVQDENGNKTKVEFQLDRDKFIDCWHKMSNFGIMLFRIPRERKNANGKSYGAIDATIPLNTDYMVGIGEIIRSRVPSEYSFLKYKMARDFDTTDPLEVGQNYWEINNAISCRFDKYIEDARKKAESQLNIKTD